MTDVTHTAYSNKDRMGLIIAIENEIDVASLKLDDIHIWPFVRHVLMERLVHWVPSQPIPAILRAHFENLESSIPNVTGWGGGVADDPFARIDFASLFPRKLSHQTGVDALFLCRAVETKLQFEGRAFNSLIDPYIDLIDGIHSYLKIELGNENPRTGTDDHYPVTRLPWPRRIVADEKSAAQEIGRVLRTNGITQIEAVIRKYLPAFDFSLENDLFEPLVSLRMYRSYFRRFLTGIRPRAVFLSCYWYPIGMAMIHAAKDEAIPVIEIQHGGTAEFNHPYSHWRRFPKDGYKLLPDFFWCWGQREVDMYRRWYPPGCRVPIGIHGGNPSLMPSAYEKFLGPLETVNQLADAAKSFERVVLAPLGTEQYGDLHDIVYRAMQIAPKNWLWLVRGHPHYFHDKWPSVERKVAAVLPGRYEMALTSALPLPAVLKHADHLVGGLSGIWVDALAFGTRPTLVGDIIRMETPDLAGNQAYLTAQTPEQLLKNIIDHPKSDPAKFRWFVDISSERALRTIETILA